MIAKENKSKYSYSQSYGLLFTIFSYFICVIGDPTDVTPDTDIKEPITFIKTFRKNAEGYDVSVKIIRSI